MDELVKLERRIQSLYDKALQPLAGRLAFDLPMSEKDAAGLPSVLFLGNHSSGKSTFVNFLVGREIQKTGLAPTDDGFTIITYGEKQDEFDGQTVVTHPDLTYRRLQQLGPAFLSRLRLKTLPCDLLQSFTLIDSPGMIDAAGTANTRGYDFTASVRYFAETADLVLFFFDPDKPGTTGETVSIFTHTLAGLEYKLLIIMNKVDRFANIRDFARTYGTLCWNLAKMIKTKDIPHIYNTYLPQPDHSGRSGQNGAIPVQDFDVSREEVIAEIKRTPTRRSDNLVSDLHKNANKLAMHTRVCHRLARRYRSLRYRLWGAMAVTLLLTGVIFWFTRQAESWTTPFWIVFTGVVLTGGIWLLGRYYLKQWKDAAASPDQISLAFQEAYHRELALHDRADLRAVWESVKPQTLGTLNALGIERIPCSYPSRRMLRRLDQVIEEDIPELRRDIANYHRQRRDERGEEQPAKSS